MIRKKRGGDERLSHALLRVTFCINFTVSQGKGSTVFCKLELHVLRQENRA